MQNTFFFVLCLPFVTKKSNCLAFSSLDGAEEKAEDSLDDPIFHVDVCTEGLVIVDDLPPFDQETVTLRSNKDDLKKLHCDDGGFFFPKSAENSTCGRASVRCAYDLMQICERLMRDAWGCVSSKLRINPLKLLPSINSSGRVALVGHSVMGNTWLSNVFQVTHTHAHTHTPPCSVNILKSHANNVDEQMTERQRFGSRADFVSLFSSDKETSAVSLSLRFEVKKNVSAVTAILFYFFYYKSFPWIPVES